MVQLRDKKKVPNTREVKMGKINQKRKRVSVRRAVKDRAAEVLAGAAFALIVPAMLLFGDNCELKEPARPQQWRMIRCEAASEQPVYPDAEEMSCDWDSTESYLLAKLAMAEAENQSLACKAMVIRTVLNRVASGSFPDSIAGVIFEGGQFTPVSDGRWDRVEPDEQCWKALDIVRGGWDESQGALYFEVTSKKETWHSRSLKKLFECDEMTFYRIK